MTELSGFSRTIETEIAQTSNLKNLQLDENSSLYYEEMARGLAVFEKLERLFDEINFFTGQDNSSRNYQAAAQLLKKLEHLVNDDYGETVQLLNGLGKLAEVRERVA